jgi:hypothetical protein
MHSDNPDPRRAEFMSHVAYLGSLVLRALPFDAAADTAALTYMENRLPLPRDKASAKAKLSLKSRVRLRRPRICRIVAEADDRADAAGPADEEEPTIRVVHIQGNSRLYREVEPRSFEIRPEQTDAMEAVILSWPEWTVVGELPLDSPDQQLAFAALLQKEDLIAVHAKAS